MKITAQDLSVSIYVDAWQMIMNWIRLADGFEVSGLGLVEEEHDDDGRLVGYLVTDVFLPEQLNGRTSTELKPEAIAKLMLEVEEQTGASERLRYWWHHHPGGIGLMWSHTDDDCVEELHNGQWFVSTVFDPEMACRTRLDLYSPVRLTLDQIPTKIRFTDFGLAADCKDIYEKRVTRKAMSTKAMKSIVRRGGLFPFRSLDIDDEFNPIPTPAPGRHVSAEELLLAQEQVDAGMMSFGEYVALAERADCLLDGPDDDPGWFELGMDDEDDDGEEVTP